MRTLSLARHVESLWADERRRAYALILPAKLPGLRERIAAHDVDDWDLLWTGELDADERAVAPVLVTLNRESGFTRWLLTETPAGLPAWGALALSRLPFLALRMHARALCKARLPDGQGLRLDWMDPEVMEALLPVATAEQLACLYAGFDALVTTAPDRWTRWSVDASRLVREVAHVA